MVHYTDFLTKNTQEGLEDPTKFAQWEPKIKAYNQKLNESLKDYAIELPESQEKLWEDGFDAVEYLYLENLLSDKEFAITDSSSETIVSKIANSEWSAVEVLEAFGKRAVIAHQFTNCAVEVFIDEGLERAKYLDEYLKTNGKTIGPLHGLPISLKEHLDYKNKAVNGSFVGMMDNVAENHGITTQVLENLGAVFYIRTNQPQGLMHLCSENNITGITKVPFNLQLTSGGSSSGEGALVSFGGSPIGIGTDIGGSIRAPAAFSGCHGFKPTANRISLLGGVHGGGANDSVPATAGPLTRTIGDIRFWMENYINAGKPFSYDQFTVPVLWRKVEVPEIKNLTIGVIYDDGIVKPSAPILRGLDEVVAKLEAAGAKVIKWEPLKTQFAFDAIRKLYNSAGNIGFLEKIKLSGEPIVKLSKWLSNYGDGSKQYLAEEVYQEKYKIEGLKHEYTQKMDSLKIDILLGPANSSVAPKTGEAYNWSYTSLFNILDFPSLVFQTGLRVDPKVDTVIHEARTPWEELSQATYDPETMKGAPIALQLTGRRYQDEEVVAVGLAFEKLLGLDLLKSTT